MNLLFELLDNPRQHVKCVVFRETTLNILESSAGLIIPVKREVLHAGSWESPMTEANR